MFKCNDKEVKVTPRGYLNYDWFKLYIIYFVLVNSHIRNYNVLPFPN